VVDRVSLAEITAGYPVSQPVVADGRVYVSYQGGTIYQPNSVGGTLGFSAANLKNLEFKLLLDKGVSSVPTITVADGYIRVSTHIWS